MQTRTAAFDAAVVASHRLATRCDVFTGVTAAGAGSLLYTGADITKGSVTVDVNNAIRRTCKLDFVDRTGALTPATASDLLSPLTGNELKLYRGITYPTGGAELIPLGVFGISKVDVNDTPAGVTIAIEGYDRARRVQRAALTDTYRIADGTNVATAIQALIASRVPGLTYAFTTTTVTTPGIVYKTGDDPWAKALALAASIGCDLYFDALGTCSLVPVPDPTTQPVSWTYAGASTTVTKLSHGYVDVDTYNDFVVTGGGTGVATPVRAVAKDTNPQSPTYISGAYGDVVKVVSSNLITTAAQALTVATALLQRSIGVAERLTFDIIVNPAHDVGDVVRVTRGKVDANYVLDALTVPLDPSSAMVAVARRRNA